MARRSNLSRDQRRKQKLAKRHKPERVQVYEGNKYKSVKFAEALLDAEIGIHESFVMTDRQLTDLEVRNGIERLILELRGPRSEAAIHPAQKCDGANEDLVIWRIRSRWHVFFTDRPQYCSSDLCGILRTILSSVEHWSRPTAESRGYLKYLEGFLGRFGISVDSYSEEEFEALRKGSAPEERALTEHKLDDDERSDEENLIELGDAWLESGDAMAWKEFENEARSLLDEGRAATVVAVCQHLLGKANDVNVKRKLEDVLATSWAIQMPRQPKTGGLATWVS